MNNIITQSFVFLLAVSTLDAATIAWESPVRILSPNDVSTTGTLLEALNIQDNESSPLDVTLHGTHFRSFQTPANTATASAGGYFTFRDHDQDGHNDYAGATGDWTTLDALYQDLLVEALWSSRYANMRIILNNLIPGHWYEIQLWINDSRSGGSNSVTISAGARSSVRVATSDSSGIVGGLGHYVIGSFTADASTLTLTLSGNKQINAIQLRIQFDHSDQWTIVHPEENPSALKNPLKGWRGQIAPDFAFGLPAVDALGTQPIGSPYESLRKWYANWNELEPNGTHGLPTIIAVTNKYLGDFPAHGMKAIPRIQLITNGGGGAKDERVPADLPSLITYAKAHGEDPFRNSGWYRLPEVKARIERLIQRVGQVWDNDPRVAYVEMGVYGKFGEHWGLHLDPEAEDYLQAAFSAAFKNKKVMLRYEGSLGWANSRRLAEAGPYGFYEDSFGVSWYEPEARGIAGLDNGNRWKVAPMGGEGSLIAHKQKAGTVDLSFGHLFEDTTHQELIEDWIRRGHTNHLGSPYGEVLTTSDPAKQSLSDHFHRLLGYRYRVLNVTYPRRVDPGQTLSLYMGVKNVGSSPFYYDWPVQINLLDPVTRQPVWSETLTEADIRDWLPAQGWDMDADVYETPAATYHVQQTFTVPADLPIGQYVLALAVLDPEGGMKPALRFAINNYWEGGYHPLGYVGIGEALSEVLDASSFFTDGIDPSLHYDAPYPNDRTPPSRKGKRGF